MALVYFDIAAILISVIILIALLTKKLYKSNTSKVFLILTLLIAITTIFDAFSCYPNIFSKEVLEGATTGYHFCRNLLLLFYLIYVITLCGLETKIKKNKILLFIFLIPISIVLLIILFNPMTHLIFSYNNVNPDGSPSEFFNYYRGPLIYLVYINSILYLSLSLFIIIKYRKLFNYREILSIVAIFPLTIVSLIIQFLNKGLLIEMLFSSFSAFLLSVSIDRPEEYIDKKFNIGSIKLFIKEIKKSFIINNDSYYIMIKIKNYYEIYNQFSYDDAIDYVRLITSSLIEKYTNIYKNIDAYYLDEGIFAICASSYDAIISISNQINNDMKMIKNTKTMFNPDPQLVIINVLDDFNDLDDVLIFINNYKTKMSFNGELLYLKDIKNDKNYNIISNIDDIIENGLLNNEFEVYYQPIYNVKTSKFHSAEALVRLITKDYGFISPALFIPYTEKTGRVVEIDRFVFENVCKFISSEYFNKIGLEYIEVNLSTVDCVNPNLYKYVTSTMEKYGVKPEQINIELTESFNSLNEVIATENINNLKNYGIKFSLDDYGTGYSNMERFSILPISFVKIDKSLVDSSTDDRMQIVLKNTFTLIKSLRRATIIEGIETEEQAQRFIDFDCDNIQGYYYSKPLPLNDFINFIKEKNEINETS